MMDLLGNILYNLRENLTPSDRGVYNLVVTRLLEA